MSSKNSILLYGVICVLLIEGSVSMVFTEECELPPDFEVSEYFSLYGSGVIDWHALRDPDNNPILNACLRVATEQDLKALGKADLQERLARLERGGLIKETEGRYTLAFPVVVGQKRNQLQEYVERSAVKLLPTGEKMIAEIRLHLTGREEMLFHVLWSVIMDGSAAWNTAKVEMNKKVKTGDTSIQNKAWLLYPPHPFRVGTNSYDTTSGHLRITWNPNTPSPHAIHRVISHYESDLVQAIRQTRTLRATATKEALSKYGLVDKAGRVQIYTLDSEANSQVVQDYMKLGEYFGQKLMTHLDVAEIADMLEVRPGVALVIAYHEICWQLLQNLAEKKVLDVPPIVAKAQTDASEAYQLVSLVIVAKAMYPFLKTEISEEEKATLKRFNEINKRIIAGEKYFNLSTPVDGYLSYLSAIISKDAAAFKKTSAIKISGAIPFDSFGDFFRDRSIYRVPPWPENPNEGDVQPIYVMAEREKEFSDVEVFIYHQGRWRKLFNMGNPRMDWRKAVDRGKSLME